MWGHVIWDMHTMAEVPDCSGWHMGPEEAGLCAARMALNLEKKAMQENANATAVEV